MKIICIGRNYSDHIKELSNERPTEPVIFIKPDSSIIAKNQNFIIQKIENPDDDLMFALILKNLSDRQISIDKKLINFIIKRIDRSYSNIFNFIYKVDELSLKKKKPIDFKLIKEVLGE